MGCQTGGLRPALHTRVRRVAAPHAAPVGATPRVGQAESLSYVTLALYGQDQWRSQGI